MLDVFDVGLYVANYKYSFDMSNTTASYVENTEDILKYFLTMQRDVTTLGSSILSSQEPESNPNSSFDREPKVRELNSRLLCTRDTYYTRGNFEAEFPGGHYYGPPPPLHTEQARKIYLEKIMLRTRLKMITKHLISMGTDL